MDEYSDVQLPPRLTLVRYSKKNSNYMSGGSHDDNNVDILTDMLTEHDPYLKNNSGNTGGSNPSDLSYTEVKSFFNKLENDGVNVKVSLNDSSMTEFFNTGGADYDDFDPLDGGKSKDGKKRGSRKMNEYMKLSTHIRSLLKDKMESQLGGKKLPAIAGTKVISHIINDIKTEDKITNAEEYFSKASSYIKNNYNKLLDMIKKLMN
jgi:hypothetical protein